MAGKGLRRADRLLVGGVHAFDAAGAAGCLRRVWCSPARQDDLAGLAAAWMDKLPKIETLSEARLRERFGREAHQGVVAEIEPPAPVDADELLAAAAATGRPLVALEEVQDPQNFGSVIRAVAALDGVGVVVTRHRSAPMSAATVRASVGHVFTVPVAVVGGMPNWLAATQSLPKVATLATGGVAPESVDLAGSCILVLGSEGEGLRRLTAERCDVQTTIPMAGGADSLNVAQCATILLYEAQRQRRAGG